MSTRGRRRVERARERAETAREAAGERATHARQAAGERMETARDAAGERMESTRVAAEQGLERAGERLEDARAAAEEIGRRVKPRLRGVLHLWAFVVSLAAGIALVVLASGGESRLAAGIYAFSLSALLGTSALYHRVDWQRPGVRLWVRRLDHSMIFVLIAGTLTPFALLVMDGPWATALLVAVWGAAALGIVVELIWLESPKWVAAAVYLGVGWVGALGFPAIWVEAGIGAAALIVGGGVLYSVGAIVYARQRPDPNPAVFGYHEIFHALVVAAAALHFAAIAIYAVPLG